MASGYGAVASQHFHLACNLLLPRRSAPGTRDCLREL